jgi:hypothetical protein
MATDKATGRIRLGSAEMKLLTSPELASGMLV